jgi:hypothetical protein
VVCTHKRTRIREIKEKYDSVLQNHINIASDSYILISTSSILSSPLYALNFPSPNPQNVLAPSVWNHIDSKPKWLVAIEELGEHILNISRVVSII